MVNKPSNDSLVALNDVLPSIKSDIKNILLTVLNKNDMSECVAGRVREYYTDCLDNNLVGGKLARARTVCESYKFCSSIEESDVNYSQFQAALVLGWAVEILQAFFLIEDDVMDKGETRRGRPCWYRFPGVGIANAINDGLLLEQVLYELVELNQYTKPYALTAQRIIRDASLRTVLGQHLDTHPPTSLSDFTRDQWLSVVRFKTAFYTFVLPCELGILISGKTFSKSDLNFLRRICLDIGELFQAQDDMLDCFADPCVIGKIGRDIEEGKCTWLWYTAMDLLGEESKELRDELIRLFTSFDRPNNPETVSRIKDIYRKIGIEKEFENFCKNITENIFSNISKIDAVELKNLANWLHKSTINRKK